MRKSLKAILLGAAVIALLCLSALAAAPAATTGGFYDLDPEGTAADLGVTIKVYEENGTTEVSGAPATVDGDEVDDFYADGVRMTVKYTGEMSEGDQFLVMLVTGDELPDQAEYICYIDQKASASNAASGTIEFDVFPLLPAESTEMTLYITSNASGFEQVAIPVSYAAAPYPLGDVDLSKAVNSTDATWILQSVVKLRDLSALQETLGDVDLSGATNSTDATYILQYVVHIIDDFKEVQ